MLIMLAVGAVVGALIGSAGLTERGTFACLAGFVASLCALGWISAGVPKTPWDIVACAVCHVALFAALVGAVAWPKRWSW